MIHKLLPVVDSSRCAHQQLHQFEFHRGQNNVLFTDPDLVGCFIQGNLMTFAINVRYTAAQHGFDPGDNLARAVRLTDVIIGPELETDNAVDLFDSGRSA